MNKKEYEKLIVSDFITATKNLEVVRDKIENHFGDLVGNALKRGDLHGAVEAMKRCPDYTIQFHLAYLINHS